jgi:hypothetical protein
MYTILKDIHHYVALITLMFILLLTVVAFIYYLQERSITGQVKKISLFTLAFTHVQVILGIILLLNSPIFHNTNMKDIMGTASIRRNYVEHPFSMIIVAILVTVVNYHIKKSPRITAWMLALPAISLALVIGMIPRVFWSTLIP